MVRLLLRSYKKSPRVQLKLVTIAFSDLRAQNNGRSTDNVQRKRRLDQPKVPITGYVDRSGMS